MSDRETRLRSLLEKVRARRPEERETRAADVLERVRTASGSVPAASVTASEPPLTAPPLPAVAIPAPTPIPGPTPTPALTPMPEPRAASVVESPTRYSSRPPEVERPLAVEMPAGSARPEPIRPQSVVPTGQPVVRTTAAAEFARPKTFGDLLELTLSLRPR